jgi:hypothetical protein
MNKVTTIGTMFAASSALAGAVLYASECADVETHPADSGVSCPSNQKSCEEFTVRFRYFEWDECIDGSDYQNYITAQASVGYAYDCVWNDTSNECYKDTGADTYEEACLKYWEECC